MGRARRNQRDEIRKRRALKRKKIFGESDEVDSSLAKILLRQRNEIQQGNSSTDDENMDMSNKIDSTLENKTLKSKEANNVIQDTHANSECTLPMNQEKKIAVKKPLDNIERMRLRKRERKAKRRAKKGKLD
jgi:hypothetical protein